MRATPARLDSVEDALVYIVDDDEPIRRSLLRLFRSMHVPAEAFASPQEYLSHARHDGPCCLVLDIQMPGVDGLELQRTLADRATQIVFLTGHAVSHPAVARAASLGVQVLAKPIESAQLRALVT